MLNENLTIKIITCSKTVVKDHLDLEYIYARNLNVLTLSVSACCNSCIKRFFTTRFFVILH